ncbi:hypothetical protein BJY52DRAFT_1310765 [Lactarius psammicola]|nr:hypothetical protein BJY52DRAFT_1310765 [Lactarius psammicola]
MLIFFTSLLLLPALQGSVLDACATPYIEDVPGTRISSGPLQKFSEVFPVFKSSEGPSVDVEEDECGEAVSLGGEHG